MKTFEEIKTILTSYKTELREKYKVKEIGIFGSYIRNEQSKKRDLDILVDFYDEPDLFTFIEIKDYLSKILRLKVDLVMKSTLKPFIRERVLKEAVYL